MTMSLYWILFLLTFSQGLSEEVCTTVSGGVTIAVTCTGDERCCEGSTSCCSGLPVAAVAGLASCAAMILVVVMVIAIYNIKQKKKTSLVQDIGSTDKSNPNTEHPLHNQLYALNDSGSGIHSPQHLSATFPDTEISQYVFERYDPSFRHPSPDRPEYNLFLEEGSDVSRKPVMADIPSINIPAHTLFKERTDVSRDHMTSNILDCNVTVECSYTSRDDAMANLADINNT